MEDYQPRSILEVIIAGAVIALLYWLRSRQDAKGAEGIAGAAAEKIAAAYGDLTGDLQSQITDLRSRQAEAMVRIAALEDREVILVGWIRLVHKGIGDGSIPPLPDIPDQVRALLGP